MPASQPRGHLGTHEVFNQPAMANRDPWAEDATLRRMLGEDTGLAALGAALATPEIREAARDAQTRLPELRTFDRNGRRIDEEIGRAHV